MSKWVISCIDVKFLKLCSIFKIFISVCVDLELSIDLSHALVGKYDAIFIAKALNFWHVCNESPLTGLENRNSFIF